MKIVVINKSDSTGGAAVVSRRLTEALRSIGVEARMLVVEKLTDSPFVATAASPAAVKWHFLKERLGIFLANGFSRSTLFRIDDGAEGLPLWRHPLVAGADAVLLNWVNQGMLSLRGVERILGLGKPVVWTMHDMWCMTGVCHHAGLCEGYLKECGRCPLLGAGASPSDLSRKVWLRKRRLGELPGKMAYVAVSRWLAGKARESSLLRDARVEVIPNAFPMEPSLRSGRIRQGRIRMLFGAARVDDPVKGLPVLVETTRVLALRYPELAERMELLTFGGVKDPASLRGMGVAHSHAGMVKGEEAVRKLYEEADILVSASSYETLPGTLVEAQAYGCVPVSFNQGGQADITDHLSTGYIAEWSADAGEAASRLADGVAWAAGVIDEPARHEDMLRRMRENVSERFSGKAVAEAYLRLIESLR